MIIIIRALSCTIKCALKGMKLKYLYACFMATYQFEKEELYGYQI